MKKLISMVLTLMFCAGLAAPTMAADFSDVPAGHPFYDAIQNAAEKGVVSGYNDGTFRPASTVTKSNFAVMLSRAFYAGGIAKYNDDYNLFTYGPFAGNYLVLHYKGVFDGSSFKDDFSMINLGVMNTGINRYDMAQLIANIMKDKGLTADASQKSAAQSKIADYSAIPNQYKDAVTSVYALGIIGGFSDGSFGGSKTMNRGQAAAVICRLAQHVPAAGSSTESGSGTDSNTGSDTVSGAGGSTGSSGSTQTAAPGMLTNGKPITVDNVVEILEQLKRQYPDGTDFAKGYPGLGSGRNGHKSCIRKITDQFFSDHNLRTSTVYGCGGWAAFVADSIFGQDAAFRKTTFDKVRPGDLVILMNLNGQLMHVAVVQSEAEINPYAGIYPGRDHVLPPDDEFDYYVTWRRTTTDAGTDKEGVYHISWDNLYQWTVDSRTPSVMFGDSSNMKILYDYYTAYPD